MDKRMSTLRILDLYCGAGGISRGMADAARKEGVTVHITGVDLYRQRNYLKALADRCEGEFIQTDAIPFLIEALKAGSFDYIHASPPCKRYSVLNHLAKEANQQDRQLETVRDFLRAQSIPYMIENVPNTPIRSDVKLKGYQFGLKTIRERWFEIGNWWFMPHLPIRKPGKQIDGDLLSISGEGGYNSIPQKGTWRTFKMKPNWSTGSPTEDRKIAMGIDWMTSEEMAQAIPPAYSEYIFTHYLRQI